jgi:hypothetical protein
MLLSCGKEEKKMNPHITRNIVTTTIEKNQVTVETTPAPLSDTTDTTFPKIVAALGGDVAFAELPTLNIGDGEGRTGYIDFLGPEDMRAPIMKGTDCHGRPFVAFRIQIESSITLTDTEEIDRHIKWAKRRGETTVTQNEDGTTTIDLTYAFVETVFRRYITGSVWTSGGGSTLCVSAMTGGDLCYVARLVKGEEVGIREYEWVPEEDKMAEEREAILANGGRRLIERHEHLTNGSMHYIDYEYDKLTLV